MIHAQSAPLQQSEAVSVRAPLNLKQISRNKATNAPLTWSLPYFSLVLCLGLALFLVLYYVKSIKPFVLLPADILMWAETGFVGDIIKLRIGVPIYTSPADSNATIYTPAAPMLTYGIAWIVGEPTSIPVWRMIQLVFALCAALVATICCRTLIRLAYPNQQIMFPRTFGIFAFLTMVLAATAPRTSPYVHALHADALALFVSMLSFWTMLFYLRSPHWGRIILMAVCPAVGYVTKQFLISWAAVMFVFLLLHNPREIKRLALFVVAASVFLSIAIGGCYLLWGHNFIFWTLEVMGGDRARVVVWPGGYNISLVRSVDHLLRGWFEISLGIIGGWLILRDRNIRKLGPLWVGWIVLISSEAFSSGAARHVLYHFGPGVLIGCVWMCAALARLWSTPVSPTHAEFPRLTAWAKPLTLAVAVLTMFVVLRVLPTLDRFEARYWDRHPSADVYRYVSDIEREFEGLPIEKVLLDVGNWIYLRHSFLARDRAISLADQPTSGRYENFKGLLDRIHSQAYDKILVRDFHSSIFLYDWEYWPKSSGVRKALMEYYTEVRTIPAANGDNLSPPIIMHTGPISVLVPKRG